MADWRMLCYTLQTRKHTHTHTQRERYAAWFYFFNADISMYLKVKTWSGLLFSGIFSITKFGMTQHYENSPPCWRTHTGDAFCFVWMIVYPILTSKSQLLLLILNNFTLFKPRFLRRLRSLCLSLSCPIFPPAKVDIMQMLTNANAGTGPHLHMAAHSPSEAAWHADPGQVARGTPPNPTSPTHTRTCTLHSHTQRYTNDRTHCSPH